MQLFCLRPVRKRYFYLPFACINHPAGCDSDDKPDAK
ncbi:hypothetical protein BN440_2168 [Erwinia amylovora MR1]|nr:hypothetical protein BN440_2168 [Erwinia amylovora MR1]